MHILTQTVFSGFLGHYFLSYPNSHLTVLLSKLTRDFMQNTRSNIL
jgi:hypothetical protein